MPIYWLLEEVMGMNVGLGNARDLKNVPGRPKTDREDAKWLSRICMFGLVLKSFIVAKPFRDLREYTRYHKKLVQERARQINRIEKLLQMNGFKLSSVLSNITGASGKRILTKLANEGVVQIHDISAALDRRCNCTLEEVECAINGVMKPSSRLLLNMQLRKLAACDGEIDEVYGHMQEMANEHAWAVEIIASIPGMSTLSAIYIIAEIGTDLASFPTANHLAAWAGLAPKKEESAGKSRKSKTKKANQYVKSLLIQCAWAATKTRNTRLSGWYFSNVKRLGDKKAITAVARKLLCYIYAMLKSSTLYDKSLDVADTEYRKATKFDAAQKIVGSHTNQVRLFKQGTMDSSEHLASAQDPAHEKPRLTSGQTEKDKGQPEEVKTPKKRGRPKKSITLEQAENRI